MSPRVALALILILAGAPTHLSADEPKFTTPEEFDKLPTGITVKHEPEVALATLTGKSERRGKYTWWYKTTVSAKAEDVTLLEFGGFAWHEGKWVVGSTFTGKAYKSAEFAEWYKCPDAVLKKGKTYTDPTNWTSGSELVPGKTKWYFVGVTADGKRVGGAAVVELKAKIDPNKPRDKE